MQIVAAFHRLSLRPHGTLQYDVQSMRSPADTRLNGDARNRLKLEECLLGLLQSHRCPENQDEPFLEMMLFSQEPFGWTVLNPLKDNKNPQKLFDLRKGHSLNAGLQSVIQKTRMPKLYHTSFPLDSISMVQTML